MTYLVIKCGGSVLEKLPESFYENIIKLQESGQYQPVIVHGGGPLISSLLNKLNIKVTFHDGLRVTTEEVLDIVEMVLSGKVNKHIVKNLYKAGGKAFGLSGVDGNLLTAAPIEEGGNLGFVGKIVDVQTDGLKLLTEQGTIPVISPIALDAKGQRYNINGDTAAAAVAKALKARLCFISDIPGIWVETEGKKTVMKQITRKKILQLIDDKEIVGGMVPKVKGAMESLKDGVPEVVILNGLDDKSLLDYANGGEAGTKITLDEEVVTHA
ncbi:N-acetylglutamate kinase [Scopulibacillus darangshiensis]|uniref:Acetylglutamate kinase n=1 Tax=Scopulibacillus darangshiensis TaxID=442528 RepID=A0A4R2P465_9BACL|nr:acetylglutamate kinase [Scopulibacillus darangshiensis]TCP28721.1 N-acetylglutamate kinase [Scopulibacillus darangshiensis]